ncbi:hypothetical protein IFM46972_08073 [Aspergillus udagawae]|uniref:Zn(2)-C6 fungal-type domain-containing protein n=1 Tax=Aspergillus udagawae TaxID=91492 RepID=A0A8H3P737_9EURO|nr:hypothetical protein IFM46972_08073 [Aspergillus udagawae]
MTSRLSATITMASLGRADKIQSQSHVTSSQLKRTTCNLCRERKVRCDREKPQCHRCHKSGQTCVYPSENTNNDEIKSALNLLHSRLLQVETSLPEYGLQITMESIEPNSPLPPQYLSHNPQLGYNLLSQGDEIGYSNVIFPEFDPSSHHQPPTMVDAVNSSGTDEAHSNLYMNMSSLKDKPPGSLFNSPFEQATPLFGLEQQCQSYFDVVQKHMMLIGQQEFSHSIIPMEAHQCMALKYAAALSGSSACGESALAMESYLAARFHLEKAENLADNSSFLNIETVQALLLVARFEFTHISRPKGLLTIARTMQLISLLGYDMLDQTSAERESDSSQIMLPKSHSSGCLQKIRRTFWIAFAMHCNATATFPCCIPVKYNKIRTAIPVPNSTMDSSPDQIVYLSEEITKCMAKGFSVFSLFILSMKLVIDGDRHREMTKKYISDSTSDYNFCLVHEKIGRDITIMCNSLSTPEFLSGPDNELRVLTCIIVLGARIDWFKTAIIGSQKAAFLGPVTKEYRTSCVAVANAMCDLLREANVSDAQQIPAYKEMTFFIMRPLALAAEVQLDILQSPRDIGYNVFSSTREIRRNLELLCNIMTVCKPATGEYNDKIQACVSFLDKTKFESAFSSGLLGNGC